MGEKAATTKIDLPAAFIDETGAIAQDRFFCVGCLVMPIPSRVLREVQKLRDKRQWYGEIKWVDLTMTSLPLYVDLIDLIVQSDARYYCFVADRDTADPVKRFKQDAWLAYEKLATQVLIGAAKPYELLSVMADNYSTPDKVLFEEDVRKEVNRRLDGWRSPLFAEWTRRRVTRCNSSMSSREPSRSNIARRRGWQVPSQRRRCSPSTFGMPMASSPRLAGARLRS